MIEYNDNTVTFNGKEYNVKGLNTSHIVWHMLELYESDSLLKNLNSKYTMPDSIHYMSLAEGKDFDALLIDDKLFRYTKLTESDMNEVQEYINKYAYATALVKLNECSSVIGCGLNHNYTLDEAYTFISKSYDKLFENVYTTKEQGRLVEGFGSDNKLKVYEGQTNYIRSGKSNRIVENWKDTFEHKFIDTYIMEDCKEVNGNTNVKFINESGEVLVAVYKNTNTKLVESGMNLSYLLKESNLINSYRVGTILEYHQPFTIRYATITSYNKDGDKIKLCMQDAFGNSGDVYITTKIPIDEFDKKYKKDINKILKVQTFGEGLDLTNEFLSNAESDIENISKIKNMKVINKDSENQVLSYKVAGFTPVVGDVPTVQKIGEEKFRIVAQDASGKRYNIVYLYKDNGSLDEFLSDLDSEIDDYDFNRKSDVVAFYQMLDDYADVLKSYPVGISTAGRRNKVEGEIKEAEGVQTTDIAPKVDQNVGGLIKVRMKKRKVENDVARFKQDLLINNLSEQDEFYGARGFIKDEKGRYHFGDYYLTESGKVVHKSKLKESLDIDPIEYANSIKEPKSEFDKLALEYKETFNTMCKYNTERKNLYAGFDEENASKHLSKEDSKRFEELTDKYNNERLKLRDISNKMSELNQNQ